MKEQIKLTLNDIDDVPKTFNAIASVIESIVLYYVTQKKEQELRAFILGLAVYAGSLMQMFGYTEEDDKDYGDSNPI